MQNKVVVSLYDFTGYMLIPWAKAGYTCIAYDIKHTAPIEENGVIKSHWNAIDENMNLGIISTLKNITQIMFAFPPCTHLAVSGAKHFETKYNNDCSFQDKALNLVLTADRIGKELNCPYLIENPVSILSNIWRKPDFMFEPFEYGGYLPIDDKHPDFHPYIVPRDAYKKKTCIWAGNGFILPEKLPVPIIDLAGLNVQTKKLGGKSEKTKTIREATPRGFAQAIYEKYGKNMLSL